jgi:glycosyltransferase involved in cell wall biosynthesis/ubiquinone/menaquinone biosynthesis C-methylase UbiE
MNKRKTLLIGILPPPINGQALAFQALADKMGVETLIISGRRNTNFWVIISKIFNYFEILLRLIYKLILGRYVIYHTISQSKEGFLRDFLIVFVSKFLGSKVVLHIHGGNYDGFYYAQKPFIQKQILRMLSMTNSIIILSKSLTKMFDFTPKSKLRTKVVNNGLLWDYINNQVNFKTLPLKSVFPIKIIFLSNLIESKGYLDVLEATSILVNEYGHNVETNFCGEFIQYDDAKRFKTVSEAKTYFYEFITKNKLGNHVNYHGTVELEKKKKLLNEAHFFVLPTNYINEGQPISIIEAMAYGCVVLSTDYRGISDMITIYESGIYVKFHDPEEIAFEVHNLTQYPTEYQRISQGSYQNYLKNYTKEIHLKTLINEIESLTLDPKNAIDFHSETALEFDERYKLSPQFRQRFQIWTMIFDKYVSPQMEVLDAGCGSGVFSIYLAQKGCNVTGIDGSEKMIELCKYHSAENNVEITLHQISLPFEKIDNYEKKDLIVCSSVLEYIIDYELVIKQFKQILNPKGLLIVSMPNQESWYRKAEKYIFKFTKKPSSYQYIQHLETEKSFTERLDKFGFKRLEVNYYPNINFILKALKNAGINEKYTNTMFVGVYQLK